MVEELPDGWLEIYGREDPKPRGKRTSVTRLGVRRWRRRPESVKCTGERAAALGPAQPTEPQPELLRRKQVSEHTYA